MIAEQLREIILKAKNPFSDILGQLDVKKQLSSALVAGRHVLIIGPSGIGKTTLAKNVAKILPEMVVNDCSYNCDPKNPICPECLAEIKAGRKQKTKKISGEKRFIRIQGSPDLTAEDLIGDIDPIKALKFGPLSIEAFTPGKIFKANNGVLFFDELNRCPEKLQNALLQSLEERKATIGSYDVDFETNFIFIGTMNPEDFSTERLSDVLMDRFDVIYMGFPEKKETEIDIVRRYGKRLCDFPDKLLDSTIYFIRLLREDPKLEKLPGVRASLGLYERAQANTLIDNRKHVNYNDVKYAMISVLSHRIKLKPSMQYMQKPEEFIKEALDKNSKIFASEEESEIP
jgi:Mg-chelatase subunit ChlI